MEARLLACDDEDDHLLVEYPSKLAVSVLVNALKGTSSRPVAIAATGSRVTALAGRPVDAKLFCRQGAPLALLRRYIEEQPASFPT